LDQRLNYLDLLSEAASRSRRKELYDSVQVQTAETKKRYRALNAAVADKQKRRAQLLADEEE
jgi:membrane protein YdbS with pleckstrin-like domain